MSVRPKEIEDLFNRSAALHRGGRLDEAIEGYRSAIAQDPSFAVAYLFLGAALGRAGTSAEAVEAYHRAFEENPELEAAPRSANAPPWLRNMTGDALKRLRSKYIDLHKAVIDAAKKRCPDENLERVEQCVEIQHGRAKTEFADEMQRPGVVYMPGLPPTPWFEREDLDWVPGLEGAFSDIREELLQLLELDEQDIAKPYVRSGPDVPEPMQHLADTYDWHSVHLYKGGERQTENCGRCPATTAALAGMPLAQMYGNAPEAFFSFLKPGAHIKPHYGVANTKSAVHLALKIPPDCAIRVGPETRTWTEGRCLIFDDSFEHEAWNRSDALRVVLITEIWNPFLTDVEKETLYELSRTIKDWADTITLGRPVTDGPESP